MADHYTQFSEVIPLLTSAEEAWLEEQLQKIQVHDGQEYPADSLPADLTDREPDWQGCRFLRDIEHPEEHYDSGPGFGWEFCRDATADDEHRSRQLWLHDDEDVNLDCVVHLVRKFLRQFRPHDVWTLTYATTCSRPRVGEFGGGGIVVTADEVRWQDAHFWTCDQREAHERTVAQQPVEATP